MFYKFFLTEIYYTYLLRKQCIGLSGQYRYSRARPDQEKSQHIMILTKDVIYFYQNNNKDIQRKKAATKYRYKKNRGRKWVITDI